MIRQSRKVVKVPADGAMAETILQMHDGAGADAVAGR